MVIGKKFSSAQEEHSNIYKAIQRSRLYTQNHSCYERMKTALRIMSILI